MSVRRSTDPVYLQYIWNAIEACSAEPTFCELLKFIQNTYDDKCSASKLQSELSNAISDECVDYDQHRYSKCDVSNFHKGKHDWYCFECHGPGCVIDCPTCFRVYHQDCLSAAIDSHLTFRLPCEESSHSGASDSRSQSNLPPIGSCPVCQRLARVSKTVSPMSAGELHKIFVTALDHIRSKVSWKTMNVVGYINEPYRNSYLVYRQINTRMITDRMRADPLTKEGYPNRVALLVDLENLIHNTVIFYGTRDVMSNMARQIRSILKREMRESSFCVDCYLRSQSPSSLDRITAPCRVSHRLIWFQHNGWSFRPCKMLYESSDGYEVICFGGRHERQFVPRSRAVDMSFTALELGLRMTPPLKKALDEAEEYRTNQNNFDSANQATDTPLRQLPCLNGGSNFIGSMDTDPSLGQSGTSPRKRKATTGSRHSAKANKTNSKPTANKRRKSAGPVAPVIRNVVASGLHHPSIAANGKLSQKHWSSFADKSDDNLTSLSSLDTDGSDYEDSVQNSSVDFPLVTKLSITKSTPQSPAKDGSSVGSLCSSAHNEKTNRNAVLPSSTRSTSSELSSLSSSKKLPRSIRIKPLPLKNDEPGLQFPQLEPIGLRDKPLPSGSSSSSAVSCPSSGQATLPAVASIGGHTPPESSLFSACSTFSLTSDFSSTKSGGRSKKLAKQTKSRSRATNSSSRASNTTKLTSSQPLHTNLPPTTTVAVSAPKIKPTPLPSESFPPMKDFPNFNSLQRHHPQSSPSASSLSDAESDTSSLLSSTSTVSSPSSSSSSSLSTTSTLPSPTQRLSFPSSLLTTPTKPKKNPPIASSIATANHPTVNNALPKSTPPGPKPTPDDDAAAGLDSLANTKVQRRRPNRSARTSAALGATRSKTTPNQDYHTNGNIIINSSSSPNSTNNQSNKPEDDRSSSCPILTKMSIKKGKLHLTSTTVDPEDSHPRGDTSSIPGLTSPILRSAGGNSLSSGFHVKQPPSSHNSIWPASLKMSTNYNDQTSHSGPTNGTSVGPTPPSNSSAASSCYSSVSPAALSSTSGLGSSLSDPKSVDASPGEVAFMLGNASFSSSSVPGATSTTNTSNPGSVSVDPSVIKSIEERVHRTYVDRLATLVAERDQAREQVHLRDAVIADMQRNHEAEIRQVKQQTWCQVCLNQAFYHCCPGTAYCSETCQLQHWTLQHNRDCRRRAEAQQLLQQQQQQQQQHQART